MIVEPVQPIRKKLPGRPVAKSTLIAEHNQFWADIAARSDFAAAYAEFFAPPPESVHQWRMQLDCGCIRGQLTRDADELPYHRADRDLMHDRELDPGEFLCCERDQMRVYWPIDTWDKRTTGMTKIDPEEPPEDWPLDSEMWEKTRTKEVKPWTMWVVTLTCGHAARVSTTPEWRPHHERTYPTPERLAEMWAEEPEPSENDPYDLSGHFRRELEAGWPKPAHEHHCLACPRVRHVVAYEYHGPLRS